MNWGVWPGGVVATALDLRLPGRLAPLSRNNLGQAVHTHTHVCVSVTKQYDFVPVNGALKMLPARLERQP